MTKPFSFSDISICHEKLAVFVFLENKNKNYFLIYKLWFLLVLIEFFGQVGQLNLIENFMMSSKSAPPGFVKIIIFWINSFDVITALATSATKFYHVAQIIL